jgi:hypothetical protein
MKTENNFSPLYKITTWLLILMCFFIPLQIAVYSIAPPPSDMIEIFTLYKDNWVLGLMSFDFILVIDNIFIIFIYLSLTVKLYKKNPALILIALALGLVGIASYFPTNPSFELWRLSALYFDAAESIRSNYLYIGEGLLITMNGTSFNVYYVLNALAIILFAYTMLQSEFFSRKTALWGMASGILMIVPSSFGIVGLVFSFLSLIPWVVFIVYLIKWFKVYSLE